MEFIIIGGIIFALAYGSTGLKLDNLEFSVVKAKFTKESNIWNSVLKIDLGITNPAKKEISFQELDCEIIYNNKKVSDFYIKKQLPLAAKDTTILKEVPFKFDNIQLLNQLMDLFTGGQMQNFQIKGTCKAGGMTFPVNQEFSAT